jgi:Branched-chain amino acid aminotransferase/4-amino-4-deoxychorismate lyase
MYLLFESIKLVNGEFQNLHHHLKRIERSSLAVLGIRRDVEMEKSLRDVARPTHGLYKARLQYNEETETIGYSPYQIRPVSSLKIVVENTIEYHYKFKDRSSLDRLLEKRGSCDDIIIVKDGFVTDSSYSNLAFRKEDRWYTPQTCLLEGTMRASLLEKGMIIETEIKAEDIKNYDRVKLINSMLGFEGPEMDISNIEK